MRVPSCHQRPSPRALACREEVFGTRDFNSMWPKSSWSSAPAVSSLTHLAGIFLAVAAFWRWVRGPRLLEDKARVSLMHLNLLQPHLEAQPEDVLKAAWVLCLQREDSPRHQLRGVQEGAGGAGPQEI